MECVFVALWTVFSESELIFLTFFFCRVIISCATLFTLEPYLNSHRRPASYIIKKYLVVREGFEPSKAFCQRIYSPPPLATRAPHHTFSGWSQRRDLNPQPADYKSGALPVELRWPYSLSDDLWRRWDADPRKPG